MKDELEEVEVEGWWAVVTVHLFCSPTAVIQKGIEAEVERLSDFFKTKVLLEYEHLSSSGL